MARKALRELLDPLLGFVFDSGLSIRELNAILREVAVRNIAAKQKESVRRVNISGIAATTGIPRAEISRIIRSGTRANRQSHDRRQQATNRILAIWHQDPKFSNDTGRPSDLKLYGSGPTFEAIVKEHGRGIPTRAMLDELIRSGAVEVLESGLVRVRMQVTVDRGVSPQAVRLFGEQASELLSTLLANMKNPENPRFIASISNTNTVKNVLPLFRRELATRGADFLADLREILDRGLTHSGSKEKKPDRMNKVGVTLFYYESPRTPKRTKSSCVKRRNFRRDK